MLFEIIWISTGNSVFGQLFQIITVTDVWLWIFLIFCMAWMYIWCLFQFAKLYSIYLRSFKSTKSVSYGLKIHNMRNPIIFYCSPLVPGRLRISCLIGDRYFWPRKNNKILNFFFTNCLIFWVKKVTKALLLISREMNI